MSHLSALTAPGDEVVTLKLFDVVPHLLRNQHGGRVIGLVLHHVQAGHHLHHARSLDGADHLHGQSESE